MDEILFAGIQAKDKPKILIFPFSFVGIPIGLDDTNELIGFDGLIWSEHESLLKDIEETIASGVVATYSDPKF